MSGSYETFLIQIKFYSKQIQFIIYIIIFDSIFVHICIHIRYYILSLEIVLNITVKKAIVERMRIENILIEIKFNTKPRPPLGERG